LVGFQVEQMKYTSLVLLVVVITCVNAQYFTPPTYCLGKPDTDPLVCNGFGLCAMNGTCLCDPGVSGPDCGIFTCFGIAPTSETVCNGFGVCKGPDTCSCFSGFNGTQCENLSPLSCPLLSLDPNNVLFPPFISPNGTFFQNDTLHIEIASPIVDQRLDTNITIQNSKFRFCKYPGPYWSNILDGDGCTNRFVAAIPWNLAKLCGWKVTGTTNTTSSQLIFSGKILFQQRENLGIIGNQQVIRTTRNAFGLMVAFQTNIMLSTTITVVDPLLIPISLFDSQVTTFYQQYPGYQNQDTSRDKDVFAAITRQEFVAGPPRMAFFGIVTKLDPGMRLVNPMALTIPPGLHVVQIRELTDPGECSSGDDFCVQQFQVQVAIDTACTLSGVYVLQFTKECFGNYRKDCHDSQTFVQLNVNSEDFCAVVQVDIAANSTIFGSSTPTFAAGLSLLSNRDGYFKTIVQSTQASITGYDYQRIHLIGEKSSHLLYDQHGCTPYGRSVGFDFIPTSSGKGFKSRLNSKDLGRKFKVGCNMAVKYRALGGGRLYDTVVESVESEHELYNLEVADKEGTVVHLAEAEFTLPPPEATNGGVTIRLGLLIVFFAISVIFM
jgi:hypothetical protein